MLFALLGISFGLKPARGGHSERFGVSVALSPLLADAGGRDAAQRGRLNSWVAMSIPDLVFMALAFWFFYARRPTGPTRTRSRDFIWDLVERYDAARQAA